MTIQLGETWVIWITGMVGEFKATVEQVNPPRLRVLPYGDTLPWPILKQDDFILIERVP